MDDVIFNVKKTKPKKGIKKAYISFVDRQIGWEDVKLQDGYSSSVDPAIEGLDSNYDNRLSEEYKHEGIN